MIQKGFLGSGVHGRLVAAPAKAVAVVEGAPLEVALAWVRDRPGVSSAVVGARTAAQLRGSLQADDVELPAEIRAALDEVSRPASGAPDGGRDQR